MPDPIDMHGRNAGNNQPAAIRFDEVRTWLFDVALPFWAENGVDRVSGGFVEQLTLAGTDGGVDFKRTRAQCRQIYCFTHAALLGWREGAEVADHGWQFLLAHGALSDGAWVRRMGRTGGVLDPTCDAYDMAFVLFSHAWRHRLTGESQVVLSALATVDALNRRLRHPNGLGWIACEGRAQPREQNPHMHIAEAALELADTTGEARFADVAEEVIALFRGCFLDRQFGVLREYYGPDWSKPDPARGNVVEPGHMLEWAWILVRAKKLLGTNVGEDPLLLFENAESLGVSRKNGLVVDQIDPEGTVLSGGSRAWPQTERLKANLAMLESYGRDTRGGIAESVDTLLNRYLATEPAGTWLDQFDEYGRPAVDKIPSSTFYHVMLAFSELLRLQQVIDAYEEAVPPPS